MKIAIVIYASLTDLQKIHPTRCNDEKEFEEYCEKVRTQISEMRTRGQDIVEVTMNVEQYQNWIPSSGAKKPEIWAITQL